MKLTILGSFSAYPSFKGFTTSQVLEHNGKSFLIDCGEGTQLQLRKNKIKFNSIEDIFISHLHGDHYFGLPGLILTFNLLGREKPLNIFGPKGIDEFLAANIKILNFSLPFSILITIVNEGTIYENNKFLIHAAKANHSITAFSYLSRYLFNFFSKSA